VNPIHAAEVHCDSHELRITCLECGQSDINSGRISFLAIASPDCETLNKNEIIAFFQFLLYFHEMVKTNFKLKTEEIIANVRAAFDVAFPATSGFQAEVQEATDKTMQADFLCTIRTPSGHVWSIACEYVTLAEPRNVRLLAVELRNRFAHQAARETRQCIVCAPYISARSGEILREAGISYIDLAGNANIILENLYVHTHGNENPHRPKREKNLFATKSARVLRVLISRPDRLWGVEELAKVAKVSLGQVSNVRQALIAKEWAGLIGGRLILEKPRSLLNEWREKYRSMAEHTERAYTLQHLGKLDNASLQAAFKEAGKDHLILAGVTAANAIAPYLRQSTLTVYADRIGQKALHSFLRLEPAALGENVIIMMPKDEGVFQESIRINEDIWATSIAQTYLDLWQMNDRSREAAEFLLEQYNKNPSIANRDAADA
jgi:hypothetical protein